MTRLLYGLLIALIFATGTMAATADKPVARIGVLAYRGSDRVEQEWIGLKQYLDGMVKDWRFQIVPVSLSSAGSKISNGELDFLLTNPGHFTDLNQKHVMSVIASRQQRKSDGSYSSEFGSAIIARKDAGIHLLQDVAGRRVAAVDPHAFGGFQIAWREFENVGVDLFTDTASLSFVGFPMDQIIWQVLNGEADVGIVRSGLVEELAAELLINADDLYFLNANTNYTYPEQTSTRLYPEWPFAAFSTTNADLRDRVALALLSSQGHPFAYESGMADTWSAPIPYHAVTALSRAYGERLDALNRSQTQAAPYRPTFLALVLSGLVSVGVLGLATVLLLRMRQRDLPDLARLDLGDTSPDDTPITKREQEILELISKGNSTKEIARLLGISPKTVEFHRANLLRKFGARTSSQLVAMAT